MNTGQEVNLGYGFGLAYGAGAAAAIYYGTRARKTSTPLVALGVILGIVSVGTLAASYRLQQGQLGPG